MKDNDFFNISEEINQHFIDVQNKVLENLNEKFNNSTFCIDKNELKTMMFDIIIAEFKEEISHNQSPVSSPMALITATLMRLYDKLEGKKSNGGRN